jgi:hypothetical protein
MPPVHFALVILEMGSQELFAQAGLELQSFRSQPGVNHQLLAKIESIFNIFLLSSSPLLLLVNK